MFAPSGNGRVQSAEIGYKRTHGVSRTKVKNELRLKSGRAIFLRNLVQSGTYDGLLNGLPTKEKNQKLISRLMHEHLNERYQRPPYVIKPEERELSLPEGEAYPFGVPAALPPVLCVGRFESVSATLTNHGDASSLVVIWFQNEFGYPPDSGVAAQLESIDWESNAGSFVY
jgi:hypothetical protein